VFVCLTIIYHVFVYINKYISSVKVSHSGPYLSHLSRFGLLDPDPHASIYLLDKRPKKPYTDCSSGALNSNVPPIFYSFIYSRMKIGFSNGDFYRLDFNSNQRFSNQRINFFKDGGSASALELCCYKEEMVDYLLDNDIDLSYFTYLSLHVPDLPYKKDGRANSVLSKLELLGQKYKINNFVFHADTVIDWGLFNSFRGLPVSIENMDDRKKFGRTIDDIKSILYKHNFKLTLDLQHCFVNDSSMKLALDFQEEFKDKIAEYHISGFDEELLHYPLFKTKQNIIIESLKYINLPIIIESAFDKVGEHEEEMKYITDIINKN